MQTPFKRLYRVSVSKHYSTAFEQPLKTTQSLKLHAFKRLYMQERSDTVSKLINSIPTSFVSVKHRLSEF
jgi:hypothetical protein